MPFSCIQERLFCYKSICLQSSRETAENIECRIQKYRIQKYRIQNTEYRTELRTPQRPKNRKNENRIPNTYPNPQTQNGQQTANGELRNSNPHFRTPNHELRTPSPIL